MRLYHGTHSGVLPAIQKEGITPRVHRPDTGVWEECPSKPHFVYLTTAYALYFALSAAHKNSEETGEAVEPVIVEIDATRLEKGLMLPDEDFVAQVLWAGKEQGEKLQPASLNRARSLTELTRRINPCHYTHAATLSLEQLGNCAYWGKIPVEAITRWATIGMDAQNLRWMASDPTITILNYRLVGTKYRSLLSHIFDGTPLDFGTLGCDFIDVVDAETRAKVLAQRQNILGEREQFVRVFPNPAYY